MPADSTLPVLRRMAGARPAPAKSSGEAPELERAMLLAAARAGGAVSALGLEATGCTGRRLDSDAVFEDLDPAVLCLLVDPPGRADGGSAPAGAAAGVLCLSPTLVDALIEVQTLGRVDGPARPARRPTRIDAALAQPFARELLAQAAASAGGGEGERQVPGPLRPGTFVAGPMSLPTILTGTRFLRLDLTLSLGSGARNASITLIMPHRAAALAEPRVEGPSPVQWRAAVDTVMPTVPVRLEAVIQGTRLPLSKLLSLKPGDLIALPDDALSGVVLHGGSSGLTLPGRRRIPRGTSLSARLGQLSGRRAVKISALPGRARPSGGTSASAGSAAPASPGPAASGPSDLPDLSDVGRAPVPTAPPGTS